jgi:alpha-galactosidase/6-phospho-beta-glucosidase family protein
MNASIAVYGKANSFDYAPSQKTAKWIRDNSEKPERVFLTNWSVFTLMFFENSYNVYTTGIEPMALKNYDEGLYWKYYNMFAYGYYCEKQMDCKEEIAQKKEEFKLLDDELQKEKEKENGRKIVESIKNDFDSKFIVSTSNKLTVAISLNPDLIEKTVEFESEKFNKGAFMKYTVFKLK